MTDIQGDVFKDIQDIPTLDAPRPINAIIQEGEKAFVSASTNATAAILSDLEIDEYVTHFYERRVDLVTFEPHTFTLAPHELNELLDWIKSHDHESHQEIEETNKMTFSPYNLYRRVMDAKLSVPEQLICFEHIYLIIRKFESSDVCDSEVNIFGDESAMDDTYDD